MTPSETSIPALAQHLADHGQGRICSFYNKKKGQERGPRGRKVVYGDSTDFVVGFAGFRYDRMIAASLRELDLLDADALVTEFASRGITAQTRDWTKTSPLYSDRAGLARVAALLELDVSQDAPLTRLRTALKAAGPRRIPISKHHTIEALASLKANLEGRVLAAFLRGAKGRLLAAFQADDSTTNLYNKTIASLVQRAAQEGVTVDVAGLAGATSEEEVLAAWDDVEAVFQAGGAAVDVNRDSFDVLTDDTGKVLRGARIYKKSTGHDTRLSLDEWLKRPIPGTINLQIILLSRREIEPPTNGPVPRSVSGPVAVAKRLIEAKLRVGQYRSYRMEPLSVAVFDSNSNLHWRRYSTRLDATGTRVHDDDLNDGDRYVTIAGNQVRRGGEWGLKMGGSAVAAVTQVANQTGKPLTANTSASSLANL